MQAKVDGLLVLDKPAGMTSRAAVDEALRWFPRGTRMGHTGTLDPLATGVLVLCLGSSTRLTEYVQRMAKIYRAGILLGARSDTDDADGTVTPTPGARPVERAAIETALARFVGDIDQTPPAFSAAHVAGQRAYDLARKGHAVSLEPRRITIYAIDILRFDWPLLELEVRCGKGTYIRSLARDLGERLGVGGLIQTLRRTRVGPFAVEDAAGLDTPAEAARAQLLPALLALADLPRVTVTRGEAMRLRQGQGVALTRVQTPAGEVAVVDEAGQLIAVGRWLSDDRLLRPEKVWQA